MKRVVSIKNLRQSLSIRLSRSYRLVRASGWFDPDYYNRLCPDVATTGQDALSHWLLVGLTEWKQPHPLFSPGHYLSQFPMAERPTINPLAHYLKTPPETRKNPSHLFDAAYYRRQFSGASAPNWRVVDACQHYLHIGEKEGKHPHPYFDPAFYRESNTDVDWTSTSPLVHYLTDGCQKRLAPSPFFDSHWYGLLYDRHDHENYSDWVWHYLAYGIREGKSPSPFFDPAWYRRENDLAAKADPYRHFLETGAGTGRRPCPSFDPLWYGAEHGGLDATLAFRHYLAKGCRQGDYPCPEVAELPEKPLISIIVPVYNPTAAQLESCIISVARQSYPHWQLCLADDASQAPHVREILERWAAKDERIVVTFLEKNQGIAGASNAAAAMATGEFLGFLDNDDELTQDALFIMAREINRHGDDLYYSDEDLIGADGRRHEIFAKPAYNREMLLAHNCITHFLFVRRRLFTEVGGFTPGMDGAQDYDLTLRLVEKAGGIRHVPEVLYHWRAAETSVSMSGVTGAKHYALEAGRRALEAACERQGIEATVEDTELFGFYRLRRRLTPGVAVQIMVAWRREPEEFAPWLARLRQKAGYPISGVEQLAADTEQALLGKPDAELYVFVDGALDDFNDGWLAALLEYWPLADIGLVCGRVRRRQNGEEAEWPPWPERKWMDSAPAYARFIQQQSLLMNRLFKAQDVWLATPELWATSAALWRQLGGFSSDFSRLFRTHDLSFRLAELGKRLVYTPYASAWLDVERENGSRLARDMALDERRRFQQRWQATLAEGDPYYNVARLEQGGLGETEYRAWLLGRDDDAPRGAGRTAGAPLVSVVIPAYNHEKFVGAAVESVLRQSMADLELIVVDDGSTDKTGEVVRSYDDKRLSYIYQENQDAYNTINRGLRLARGRFVAILNSDDIYHPERLARLLAAHGENGAACLFTAVTPIDGDGHELADPSHPWNIWVEEKIGYFEKNNDMLASLFHGNFMLTTSNLFMTAEARQEVGWFKPYRYLHDYDFILRMALAYPGKLRYLAGEKLLSYRLHGSNTISQAAIVGREQDMEIVRQHALASLPDENRLAAASAIDRLLLLTEELQEARRELQGPVGIQGAARELAASIRRYLGKQRRALLARKGNMARN